jgi:hypothetical protein
MPPIEGKSHVSTGPLDIGVLGLGCGLTIAPSKKPHHPPQKGGGVDRLAYFYTRNWPPSLSPRGGGPSRC